MFHSWFHPGVALVGLHTRCCIFGAPVTVLVSYLPRMLDSPVHLVGLFGVHRTKGRWDRG